MGVNLAWQTNRTAQTEDVWEQIAEANIWIWENK
jgi:hypothetical protein